MASWHIGLLQRGGMLHGQDMLQCWMLSEDGRTANKDDSGSPLGLPLLRQDVEHVCEINVGAIDLRGRYTHTHTRTQTRTHTHTHSPAHTHTLSRTPCLPSQHRHVRRHM